MESGRSSYAAVIQQTKAAPTTSAQYVPREGHEEVMHKNSCGAYVYQVSDKELLERYLILGTATGTYYAEATTLTSDAIREIKKLATTSGQMVLDTVKDIYESGRAPKQSSIIFVLGLLTQVDMPIEVRRGAFTIIRSLRILSHVYELVADRKATSGHKSFGRGMRDAVEGIFSSHDGKWLAYQATKYGSRSFGDQTWSIKDVIACAHVASKRLSQSSQVVMSYVIKDLNCAEKTYAAIDNPEKLTTETLQYLRAVEAVKNPTCTTDDAIQFIRTYKLPRETLNTVLLKDPNVWKALLYVTSIGDHGKACHKITMPMTALVRNLGVLSQRGIFDDEIVTDAVVAHLTNQTVLCYARVHPVALLVAKATYGTGRGLVGKLTWPVNKKIVDALEDAFYLAFGNIKGSGKRILHAVDCSGSMTSPMGCIRQLTSCQAVSTLVMEAIRREHKHHTETGSPYVQDVVLFNHQSSMVTISPTDKLDTVMRLVQDRNFGSTDCSQPMLKAMKTMGLQSCAMFPSSRRQQTLHQFRSILGISPELHQDA